MCGESGSEQRKLLSRLQTAERVQHRRESRRDHRRKFLQEGKFNSSTRRAATCAGPTREAAKIAVVVATPIACRSRGRCAAKAVATHQVAPKRPASPIIVQEIRDGAASCAGAFSARDGSPFGITNRFIGRPIEICNPGDAGATPAKLIDEERAGRPTDRADEAGKERDAGDRIARLAAVKAR